MIKNITLENILNCLAEIKSDLTSETLIFDIIEKFPDWQKINDGFEKYPFLSVWINESFKYAGKQIKESELSDISIFKKIITLLSRENVLKNISPSYQLGKTRHYQFFVITLKNNQLLIGTHPPDKDSKEWQFANNIDYLTVQTWQLGLVENAELLNNYLNSTIVDE